MGVIWGPNHSFAGRCCRKHCTLNIGFPKSFSCVSWVGWILLCVPCDSHARQFHTAVTKISIGICSNLSQTPLSQLSAPKAGHHCFTDLKLWRMQPGALSLQVWSPKLTGSCSQRWAHFSSCGWMNLDTKRQSSSSSL